MYHLNQSGEQIIGLTIILFLSFLISAIVSFLFLKIFYRQERKTLAKAIIPNFIFFFFSFILYLISIFLKVNISVFSRNESSETTLILISLIVSLALLSIIEKYSYKIIFKVSPFLKFYYLLFCLNLFTYLFIFYKFYPKSYVGKDIINYNRYVFEPNKKELKLSDKTFVHIDLACSSENNYKTKIKDSLFSFRIPVKEIGTSKLSYSFRLVDDSYDSAYGGEGHKCHVLLINKLKNDLVVLFVQEDLNEMITSKKRTIIDTIVFRKIKTEIRQAGYYGDSNCDCIEN